MSPSKEDIMASTTYRHPGDVTGMFAAQEQFRDITKTYHLGNVTVMVRNAGQLPQPFWLGDSYGGGSCSLSASVARA